MPYLPRSPDKCIQDIDKYLTNRLPELKGKDRSAVIMEFKEWILDQTENEADIWTMPDLTDEALLDFFKRAISRK